jgi:DNA-binding SARP family transcriptional activator
MAYMAIRILGDQHIQGTGKGEIVMPDAFWTMIGCLLAAPSHRIGRARLISQLWPEREDGKAQRCLASALWRIRSRFTSDDCFVVTRGDTVALVLQSGLWIDAVAFELRVRHVLRQPGILTDPCERLRLGRALRLYTGDLLPSHEPEVIAIERARLRSLYLDALYELSMAEARANDWAAVRRSATTLCAAEPLREDAQRLLIEAYARCGNRALALQQFRVCETVLAQELAVEPMPETRALVADLLATTTRAGTPVLGTRETLTAVRSNLTQTLDIIERALALE